ncbi:MAG: hypothetical protein FWE36_04890 [Erysipelotrichales bacterium]|nr:hypothetical protein [Erysipelotrichales bacterium]
MQEKINHARVNNGINNARVSTNVATGRILTEVPASGIGSGSFRVDVSHIYNQGLSSRATTTFRGLWKLNIEQFLIRRNFSVRVEEEFEYVDEKGFSHIFVYLTHSGNTFRYYDTSGLNLILTTTGPNHSLADGFVITDENENQLIFNVNGRLIESISSHNSSNRKIYNYVGNNLSEVFDNRRRTRSITFHYVSSRLAEIRFISNGIVRKSIHYDYDLNNNLRTITRRGRRAAQRANEHVTHFFYGVNSSRIEGIFDSKDSGLIRISYQTEIEGENHRRVERVENGFGNPTITNQAVIRARGALDIPFFGEITSANFKPNGIVSSNNFVTAINRARVTNEKGIELNYFSNSEGDLTAVFESVGTDLRELEKRPGIDVMRRTHWANSEQINGIPSTRINAGLNFVAGNANASILGLDYMRNYRSNRCPNFQFFTIGFWLRIERAWSARSMVRINITSHNTIVLTSRYTTQNFGVIDGTAVNVWQYVEVPCDVPNRTIENVEMRFLNGLESESISIAGMKMVYSDRSTMFLTRTNGAQIAFHHINRVQFTDGNTNQLVTRSFNNTFYMSEADVQTTYQSLIKTRTNPFILSTCDGREKFPVNNVSLLNVSDAFPIATIGHHQAHYFLETVSPDASVTKRTLFYRLPPNIRNNNPEGFDIITRAHKENRSSEERIWIDFQGRIRLEVDEYGAYTDYFYDAHGTSVKSINHPRVSGESLDFTLNDLDNLEILSTKRNQIRLNTIDPLGEVSREERVNLTSTGATDPISTHIVNFTSNLFGDKLEVVNDNLNSRNNMTYDSSGRVTAIRNLGTNYHYEFEYGELDNLIRCFYVEGTFRVLHTETEIDRNNNVITRRGFRNRGLTTATDTTIISMDNFGRMTSINQNESQTNFSRQTVSESQVVSGITGYHDPFENRQQTFDYTHDDTEIKEYRNGTLTTISASGVERVSYSLEGFGIGRRAHDNDIVVDNTVFINPRITETLDLLASNIHRERTTYTFDGLGRITRKDKSLDGSDRILEDILYHANTFIPSSITESHNLYSSTSSMNVGERIASTSFTAFHFRGRTVTNHYQYGTAGQLIEENLSGNLFLESGRRVYNYNLDGSVSRETISGIVRQYTYTHGRLTDISGLMTFNYDRLGNCIRMGTDTLEYTRFNLLESYTRGSVVSKYEYNIEGIRFRKTVGARVINYYYDGPKLLAERDNQGRALTYFYNADEMVGFQYIEGTTRVEVWYYIKDTIGNIVGLRRVRTGEIIFYEYTAWGEHRIFSYANNNANTQPVEITAQNNPHHPAIMNPFRWKTHFFDQESNLYQIEGRYYSPVTKMFISPCDLEEMLYNINNPGIFNLYTISNPINFPANWHNIFNSVPVVFDPEEIPPFSWRRFWISTATLVALYGITAASGGTLLPFTAPKKKAVKLGMLGTVGRATIARGTGDISERLITGEWSYQSGWDIAWGYGTTIGIAAFGMIVPRNLRVIYKIAAQPLASETVSLIQGDGFSWGNVTFNSIARTTTLGIDNPFTQGALRGGSRGVRKRFIQ